MTTWTSLPMGLYRIIVGVGILMSCSLVVAEEIIVDTQRSHVLHPIPRQTLSHAVKECTVSQASYPSLVVAVPGYPRLASSLLPKFPIGLSTLTHTEYLLSKLVFTDFSC